jgi:FtsZ-interacting cell division protein ZipA
MDQHQIGIIVAVVVVVALLGIGAFLLMRRRRSQMLRERFGPEYDRVVRQEGNVRGEEVLQFRADRREKLNIQALPSTARAEFAERWANLQPQFVDDPKGSVSRADELVNQIMRARGYPVGDFEQRAADISVDHPDLVENYRAAHDIALRHSKGQASTEDLRKAMVHYRSLFDELLGDSHPTTLPLRKEA